MFRGEGSIPQRGPSAQWDMSREMANFPLRNQELDPVAMDVDAGVLADGLGSLNNSAEAKNSSAEGPLRNYRCLCGMTKNRPKIFFFNFSDLQHYNRTFKAELTLKAVIRTVIRQCFPRFNSTQRQLFASGPFGQFLDMPIPNGDPLLIHAMMLHEERDLGVGQSGRFRFNVQGIQVEYGESEICLITGLNFGPSANLLAATKNRRNSVLRSRVFLKETDQSLRLRHIEEFILAK
ncbi:hypothetical protein LXL04_034497 [Taraxacum kok-saghyz]